MPSGKRLLHLGRTEGVVPRQEQVFNEQYRPGDRIRAYGVKVQKKGQKKVVVKVLLSDHDYIWQ